MRENDLLRFINKLNEVLFLGSVTFITTHVYIWARCYLCQFSHYIIHKLECNFFVNTQGAKTYFCTSIQIRSLTVAIELGIRSKRCIGVPGKINFRNDGNKALFGIFYQVFVLLLRVISSLSSPDLSAPAVRCQFRPGFNFDSPSLVVTQVQMQCV